jgi:general nucleoside transport system permease protein
MKGKALAIRLVASLGAILFALLVSGIALALIGESPITAFTAMASYGVQLDSLISILNRAVPLYLSALAVGIGFKMGLFNIGVEGQYRIAALLAASVGAAVTLPPVLHIPLIMLVAVVVGGAWAGIAGALKVYRGVHEVISTIMLNFIATGLGAYLLANYLRTPAGAGDVNIRTPEIPPSGRFPSLNPVLTGLGLDVPGGSNLQGFLIVALLVGVAYFVLIWRSRFGYDLRAVGTNPSAAQASGVDPGRMILKAMMLSGGIAGLVGLSQVLGFFNRFTLDFPTGFGFAGIAVALVGRNHPVGMWFAALLFAFLNRSAQILDFEQIPKEIEVIIQGVIILSVVIAYEIARRIITAQQVADAAAKAEAHPSSAAPVEEVAR